MKSGSGGKALYENRGVNRGALGVLRVLGKMLLIGIVGCVA